jgi:dihydroorotase
MAELYDMRHAGAVAFSDGEKPIHSTSLLKKLFLYAQQFGGLVMNIPSDKHLSEGGHMHEGYVSTTMGTKGMPDTAESMAILQQLELLRYTGGKTHFSLVSSAKAVQLIRAAKAEGLQVSCDTSVGHLIFTDADLTSFDTNLKAFPPFRTEKDRLALWAGLQDGTIDVVVSDHKPQDIESKNLEFDLADFGLLGLESFFPALCTAKPADMPWDALIGKFTSAPKRLLGIAEEPQTNGALAELTFFAPEETQRFASSSLASKSKNSPFIGRELSGKVLGVACKGKLHWFA